MGIVVKPCVVSTSKKVKKIRIRFKPGIMSKGKASEGISHLKNILNEVLDDITDDEDISEGLNGFAQKRYIDTEEWRRIREEIDNEYSDNKRVDKQQNNETNHVEEIHNVHDKTEVIKETPISSLSANHTKDTSSPDIVAFLF